MSDSSTDLPEGLAKPAQRALANGGHSSLDDLSRASRGEAAALHGMGPNAMAKLDDAMERAGLSFS